MIFIAMILLWLIIAIISAAIFLIIDYMRYKKDIKAYPTISFKKFKELFEFEPDYYKNISYYCIRYTPPELPFNKGVYINIDTFHGLLKALYMIKKYEKTKTKAISSNLKQNRKDEYYKIVREHGRCSATHSECIEKITNMDD